jgi:hypothetical protein
MRHGKRLVLSVVRSVWLVCGSVDIICVLSESAKSGSDVCCAEVRV